ncbi:hypothetical protein CHCC14600_3208 [Bacillus licheniformis]|nr:hypothetical protein CHCC20493_0334 [Bacillus licheniformis]TWM89060.1 hypothetical protein CHCC14600_3208 [Bacillus licheniformis]TWN39320.1 hypothetical protein CHCC14525_3620 [Bacillus licheniformis]TWN82034.1 hypothetical protein CHCC20494_1467 [Bacillus licheniformis]
MNELNRDVSALLTSLEKAEVKRGEEINKKISQESLSLIQKTSFVDYLMFIQSLFFRNDNSDSFMGGVSLTLK